VLHSWVVGRIGAKNFGIPRPSWSNITDQSSPSLKRRAVAGPLLPKGMSQVAVSGVGKLTSYSLNDGFVCF
jgi:hypothetical protein